MADPIVEQIMDRLVATTLASLTTTGANIKRGWPYPLGDTELPAINVYMGANQVLSELPNILIAWRLVLQINVRVKSATVQVDQTLNQIHKEVHAAMMADLSQNGLAFNTTPGGSTEPEIQDGNDQPVADMTITYFIDYRTSATDISA